MQQEADGNIFSKGTKEGQGQHEKKRKRFMFVSGILLLVLAAALVFGKSEYMQNRLALFGSDADYYCYVELKNLKVFNETAAAYAEAQRKQYKADETLHQTKQISIQAEAKALLAALLLPYGVGTEAAIELSMTKQGGKAAVAGEALVAGEAYPIDVLYDGEAACYFFWPPDGEYYHLPIGWAEKGAFMGQFLAKGNLTGSKLKKLLAQYEALFFEGLSKGDVTLKKQVLRSIHEHSAYQTELAVSVSKEVLQSAIQDVFAALLTDKAVRSAYEDSRMGGMPSYEAYLMRWKEELFEEAGFLCSIETVEMKLYVDNYGRLTGRDIVIRTDEDDCRIGYAFVANGLSVGAEAYVRVNGTERFFADAVCKVKDGTVTGTASVFVSAWGELHEYRLTLQDVRVLDLMAARFSGDIFLSSNRWKGVELQISFNATNLLQECTVSAYYGDAEQLCLSLRVQEAEPAELPEVPKQSIALDGWDAELLH